MAFCCGGAVQAQQIPRSNFVVMDGDMSQMDDLQLDVHVNGAARGFVASFLRNRVNGAMTTDPVQLENVGIKAAPEAKTAENRVDLAKLPGVSFLYEEKTQSIHFTAEPKALSTHRIDAAGNARAERLQPKASPGAMVNYTVYGSTGSSDLRRGLDFQGLSGSFDMRLFGPLGLLNSSQIVSLSPNELYSTSRLDTTWSYSDPDSIVTYRVGDLITGGLGWSRPSRLGGIQIQRNFDLRSDLVTMPLPSVTGTAAVPSTVDLYVNNARRSSFEVPAGPFSISDIPAITGDANARLVVRDALGRETITETPLFASSKLLATGLLDYSAEIGFARRDYGTKSFSYDERLLAIATGRYGLTDRMTLEAHGEGGADFMNGGMGAIFALGTLGIGSVSAAGSRYGNETGYLISASVEAEFWGLNWRASSQRTFGHYNDLASVTSDRRSGIPASRAGPARAIDQVNVSVPLSFDATTLNFSFTHVTSAASETSRIFGLTASRAIGEGGNLFVTAYKDIARRDAYGVFVGFTWSFSDKTTASTGVSANGDGLSVVSDVIGRTRLFDGDLGWRISDAEGASATRSAAVSYRNWAGRGEARVQQVRKSVQASGQLEGSLVLAGGDVFIADRIDDAFGIVDAGAPDVDVEFENRPVGKTGRRGKLLVPNLRSYEANTLAIDPAGLPMDAAIDNTRESVMPHRGSGVVVRFDVRTDVGAALVILKTPEGAPVESGSVVTAEGGKASFVVGYDGQVYLTGVKGKVTLGVQQPNAGTCEATLDLKASADGRIVVPDALCRRIQ